MGAEQCKLGRGVHSRDRERQEVATESHACSRSRRLASLPKTVQIAVLTLYPQLG